MNELRKNSFEDLILDETFREYAEATNEESVSYWNNWIHEHPERADDVKKGEDNSDYIIG